MADPSRTEAATPKKREEMRKKGNVPKSREIPSAAVLLGGFFLIYLSAERLSSGLSVLFREFLTSPPGRIDSVDAAHTLLIDILSRCGILLSPILPAILLCAVASNVAQTGLLFTAEPLKPNLEKLDPVAGLTRIFSLSSLVELAKAFLKFLLVGWIAYRIIREELPVLPGIMERTPFEILSYMGRISSRLLLYCGGALLALAGADYLFQRWTYEKSIRMTKQEVREEWKEQEGDPMVKGRIRSIQREKSRRRILQEVPRADVVITNPTHVAVAIRYERGEMAAPRVTAKGAGLLARRIRMLAEEHGVPVLERPPLARSLYRTVEEGHEIPPDFYRAVAEILAHVYRLRGVRAVR
ncbi:MAG: flagellar biosynthesis protein FlhB [Deltaproteobacteria bacterium]